MKIAIAGAGAFGTALAVALALDGNDVTLWARDAAAAADMTASRKNPKLPEIKMPKNVGITSDFDMLFAADTILLAIPAQSLHAFLLAHKDHLHGKILVACCKGIDMQRMTGPATTIMQTVPEAHAAVLTGPSFAIDIAQALPTALTLACHDDALGKILQTALSTTALRLYRTTDIVGTELGGALKNVIAIAAGVAIGAGFGESARAAIITRGFREIQRLAHEFGARPETLNGLSGFGDLVLTCTSEKSRNYRYGIALGQSASFEKDITVEGAATARALRSFNNDLPICALVADLVDQKTDVMTGLNDLLSRPLKAE